MKLSEYKNLNRYLHSLFEFFKENRLISSVQEIDDYDKMLKNILDSEFAGYSCNPGIETYSISFKINHNIDDDEVYMIIFGNEGDKGSSYFLIDISKSADKYNSFFSFSWHGVKLPPFLNDFKNEHGMMMTDNFDGTYEFRFSEDQIMTFDEFESYLSKNGKQKDLKWIVVD